MWALVQIRLGFEPRIVPQVGVLLFESGLLIGLGLVLWVWFSRLSLTPNFSRVGTDLPGRLLASCLCIDVDPLFWLSGSDRTPASSWREATWAWCPLSNRKLEPSLLPRLRGLLVDRLVDEASQVCLSGLIRLLMDDGEILHLLILCFVSSKLRDKTLPQLFKE